MGSCPPVSPELGFALAHRVANSDRSRGTGPVALEIAAVVFVCPPAKAAGRETPIAKLVPAPPP
jgi:hypothetical protein